MSVHELPVEVQREFLSIKRDAADPGALRRHLQLGWGPFAQLYVRDLARLRQALERRGLTERFRRVLSRALWLKAEVLFHADFRSLAYRLLLEARQLDAENVEVLTSLIRVELNHFKLRDAALHLFEARRGGHEVPDLDLLEEDLETAIGDDLENELWDRIEAAEDRLEKAPDDATLLTDLAAEYFYEALDLERAEEVVGRALELGSEDPESWFLGAEVAFERGEGELALERLEGMAGLAPEDPRLRLLSMNVLCFLGREAEALAVLAGALGRPGKPLRVATQDVFFQGCLAEDEEYHRLWLQLLRRRQVSPDGIGYYYSSGTPHAFFESRLDAARVYHQARLLSLKFRAGDPFEEVEQGFRRLLTEAPDYTFLLDEVARFLLLAFPGDSAEVAEAGRFAERAVHLAEIAGEPEDRFHATLDAARRALGR